MQLDDTWVDVCSRVYRLMFKFKIDRDITFVFLPLKVFANYIFIYQNTCIEIPFV